MSDIVDFLKSLKDNEIEFVDFRFTDSRGKWHHISYVASRVTESFMKRGIMFDGSSIAGWKEINESDMMLVPDLSATFLDPFTASPTMVVICDVYEPYELKPYTKDPRSVAKKAEQYLIDCAIGDKAFFGPELEFFMFDDVRYQASGNKGFYSIESDEAPWNSGKKFPNGNLGHRPMVKGGYMPVQPVDSYNDIRGEMVNVLSSVGLSTLMHHHEVAASQCEIGFDYSTLLKTGDNIQKYKYVVQNVAASYGKSVTFMPKPIRGDNGSGMHVHQSIWKNDKTLFAGNEYAGLSETCLYYIGGIIKHAKAINAFTNPSTNSYKRLVPGFEAPVLLAYSSRNRSASIRIPYSSSDAEKRIEIRFPDPTANPYLSNAAMLMAGLDGIKNKIHPGSANDANLYELDNEELKKIPAVSSSLKEALQALDKDREFLKQGGVFSDELIDSYIKLKMQDIVEVDQTPNPVEFCLYYSS